MINHSEGVQQTPVADNIPNMTQHDLYIRIWAKAVDTQMHFNEMSVKSRQLGLTFVAAALGVGVVLLGRDAECALFIKWGDQNIQVHIAAILLLGAVIAIYAVRVLDLGVYHKMLRGAVTFGEDFEENYMKRIFDLDKGMTQSISHFSRFEDASASVGEHAKTIYCGHNKRSAEKKIRRFYNTVTISLILGIAALFFVTNQWIFTEIATYFTFGLYRDG